MRSNCSELAGAWAPNLSCASCRNVDKCHSSDTECVNALAALGWTVSCDGTVDGTCGSGIDEAAAKLIASVGVRYMSKSCVDVVDSEVVSVEPFGNCEHSA